MGKILITGDFYGGRRVEQEILKENYSALFDHFLDITTKSDLFITNLESPILNEGKEIVKSGPAIKAHPKTINALQYLGVNFVTLANNHILDFGEKGLISTLNYLDESKIDYVGVGNTLPEARKIVYKTIDDVKIAFINFCENEWSTATKKSAGANPFNPIYNYADITKAKKNADRVVVIFHGGNEFYHLPSVKMQESCRFFVEAGADIVLCHHTHYYSGYEKYNQGLIFYGLGNFIFDNENFKNPRWNVGYAIEFEIFKEKLDFKIIPFRQCDKKLGVEKLNDTELKDFNEDIQKLNAIILDEHLLDLEYTKFVEKMTSQYLGQLQPYTNRYIYGAYKRGYIPSVFSEKKYKLIQNLIQCESHRDVLIRVLEKENL